MASDRHVIAVRWLQGRHSVIEEKTFNSLNDFDWTALEKAHPWNDVSMDSGYMDQASVLAIDQITKYARGESAREFIASTLKAGAFMYLIHRAEYESGLD